VNDAIAGPAGRIPATDDDPAPLESFVRCLEGAGYRVATAASLQEGLRVAAGQPFQVCLLGGDRGHAAAVEAMPRQGEPAPDPGVVVVTVILSGGEVADDAPPSPGTPALADGPPLPAIGAPVTLDALERCHIEAVLAGSQTLDAAARTLGIDSSTLYRKRKAYGL
jgi:DNA-binding NtrC family response regulator